MTTLPSSLTGIFAHKQKSYKMVLTLAILDIMEELKKQEVPVNLVRARFLKLLQSRESQGQPVDAPPESMAQRWSQVQGLQINGLLQTPIKALKAVLVHDSGKQTLHFTDELQALWSECLAETMGVCRSGAGILLSKSAANRHLPPETSGQGHVGLCYSEARTFYQSPARHLGS